LGDNITINGGNITAKGGEYGGAISANNKLIIRGGIVSIKANNRWASSTLGGKSKEIIIEGGTITSNSAQLSGISCDTEGIIKINGGNVFSRGKNFAIARCINSIRYDIEKTNPIDGTNDLYETQIKLQGVEKNRKIDKIVTSDNINYKTNDMYTLEDGMIYIYLPLGKRTIDIESEGKKYSGDIETKEISEIIELNKTN